MRTTAVVVVAGASSAADTAVVVGTILPLLMLFAAVVLGSRIYGQDDPRDVGLRRFVGQYREADGDVRARAVQNI